MKETHRQGGKYPSGTLSKTTTIAWKKKQTMAREQFAGEGVGGGRGPSGFAQEVIRKTTASVQAT